MPQEETEQTEGEVDVVDHGADERSSTFGLDQTDESQQEENLENLSGDEEFDLESEDERSKLDPDTPIDALVNNGATSRDQDMVLDGESPSDEAEESPDASESEAKKEPESEQTEAEIPDVDPELLEFVQEHEDDIKDLKKWRTKLTQRSQQLKDLEKLQQFYEVATQDPGRTEALVDFANKMQEGHFDQDAEVETPDFEIPESIEGTENEEYFKKWQQTIQNLTEELNRQKRINKKVHQSNRQQSAPENDMGQVQEEPATDEVDEALKEYEDFVDDHPELVQDDGSPTDLGTKVFDLVSETGWSYEKALDTVAGSDTSSERTSSEEQEPDENPSSSELVDEEGNLTNEEQSGSERFETFTGKSSMREKAEDLKQRIQS